MKIAVIYGGISSEREVSLKTGKEIVKNLDRNKYDVFELEISKKEDIFKLKNENIDFAYIALHGIFGENGEVQAALEIMGIKYSGSGILSSALCMDKHLTKEVVKNSGVRVIDSIFLTKNDKIKYEDINLGKEIILKANKGGSSIGIFFVNNEKEFEEAMNNIFEIDDEIIIEKVIKGIEISVPIIDGIVYPTLMIEPSAEYFDYNSKYSNGGAKEYVYQFPVELQNEIDDFTRKAFKAAKCKGFARIDYIISDDKVYFLEINTLPGMTQNSLLPKSTASKGYSYSETLDLLIGASLK